MFLTDKAAPHRRGIIQIMLIIQDHIDPRDSCINSELILIKKRLSFKTFLPLMSSSMLSTCYPDLSNLVTPQTNHRHAGRY